MSLLYGDANQKTVKFCDNKTSFIEFCRVFISAEILNNIFDIVSQDNGQVKKVNAVEQWAQIGAKCIRYTVLLSSFDLSQMIVLLHLGC